MAALACAAMGLGCGHGADERESAAILEQVDRLRLADPAEREPLLASLEHTRPKNVVADQARQHCAAAYRALLENLQLTERLKQAVRAAKADAGSRPDDAAVSRDLDAAEKTLATANQEMPQCDQAMAALRLVPQR